jgi:hypothetical protein
MLSSHLTDSVYTGKIEQRIPPRDELSGNQIRQHCCHFLDVDHYD